MTFLEKKIIWQINALEQFRPLKEDFEDKENVNKTVALKDDNAKKLEIEKSY